MAHEPFEGKFGRNVFVLSGEPTPYEHERLMLYPETRWQRLKAWFRWLPRRLQAWKDRNHP